MPTALECGQIGLLTVKNPITCSLIQTFILCFPRAMSQRPAWLARAREGQIGQTKWGVWPDPTTTAPEYALQEYLQQIWRRLFFQKRCSSQQCSPGLCLKVKLTLFHLGPLPFPFLTISCCHLHLLCPFITNKLLLGISTSTTLPVFLAFPAFPLRTEPSYGSNSS